MDNSGGFLNCTLSFLFLKRHGGFLFLFVFAAMGRKSPAKWIKTVLFGKKSSKSLIVKGREVINLI
jgi:hypothetical protein